MLIRKRKRPAGAMLWGAYQVSVDDAGTWLYTPEGSTVSGQGADGKRSWSYVGVPTEPGLHVLQLAPQSGWWIAHVTVHPEHGRCVAIDICTPPRLIGNEWLYEDLELDILKRGSQKVVVYDEDEFDDACAAGHISAEEAENALASTREVVRRLTTREHPFGDSVWSRLDDVIALGLPPLLHHR